MDIMFVSHLRSDSNAFNAGADVFQPYSNGVKLFGDGCGVIAY